MTSVLKCGAGLSGKCTWNHSKNKKNDKPFTEWTAGSVHHIRISGSILLHLPSFIKHLCIKAFHRLRCIAERSSNHLPGIVHTERLYCRNLRIPQGHDGHLDRIRHEFLLRADVAVGNHAATVAILGRKGCV